MNVQTEGHGGMRHNVQRVPGPGVLLYGASGYTGRLIAGAAAERRIPIVLGGRDAAAVGALADRLGLPHRVFALDDGARVREAVAAHAVVLHCAGPFIHTFRPVLEACLAERVHYVDITGEIDVLAAVAAEDARALEAGVMLLPGAGFDVVASDCLAAHVAARLPGAQRLMLAIHGTGRLSRGTASSMVEHGSGGGRIRRDGRIVGVPAAWRTRRVDFGDGPVAAVTIPWGDVATAWHSTGIPDIEVYAAATLVRRTALRATRYVAWLTGRASVKRFLQRRIRAGPAGPSERELEHGMSVVWARAETADGRAVESRLHGPNGYALTARTALLVVQRILGGDAPPGFQTPSRAYGAAFVLEVPGTRRADVT